MSSSSDCLTEGELAEHFWGADPGSAARGRLDEHLAECAGCRRWVAELTRGLGSAPAGRPPDSWTPDGHPQTFAQGSVVAARYRIERFIGRGGMGEVYEAIDQDLDERVALKTISSTALDQPDALARFKREVRHARRVTHPHVCRVLEFGGQRASPADPSIPFLTMELLAGETVAERMAREGPFPPGAVLAIAAQILAGLAAIHEQGIVHRDLKGSNVMLVPTPGGDSRAVLMDFGLAKSLDPEAERFRSRSALVAGTLAYMSPEQREGGPVGPASDVYALGVVVFEMLTGRTPAIADWPIEQSLTRLAPGLPSPWLIAIARCLEPDPQKRFARAAAVMAALSTRPAPRPSWLRWAGAAVLGLGASTAAAVVLGRDGGKREEVAAAKAPAATAPATQRPDRRAPEQVPEAAARISPTAPRPPDRAPTRRRPHRPAAAHVPSANAPAVMRQDPQPPPSADPFEELPARRTRRHPDDVVDPY